MFAKPPEPPTYSADDPRADPRIQDMALKKRYAAEQLRQPDRDFHIALTLINDTQVAIAAVNAWRIDKDVINERLRLQEELGQRAELPTKETIMLEVLAIGREEKYSVSDRLKAYAHYSEMNNYTGRNSGAAASVNIFSNKVMLLKDHGPPDQWGKAAVSQQTNLVQEARNDAERTRTTH